jgi:hypothetical protein
MQQSIHAFQHWKEFPCPEGAIRTQPGVLTPGTLRPPATRPEGAPDRRLKTCIKNVTGIRFSAHIDNGHRLCFEKQNRKERAAFYGAPCEGGFLGGGVLGLKPQAEFVVPLRGTGPLSKVSGNVQTPEALRAGYDRIFPAGRASNHSQQHLVRSQSCG